MTEVVHAWLLDEQHELLRLSERAHQEFTPLSIEGAPVQDILDRLAEMAGHTVVLEDLAHRVVAFAGTGRRSARCSTTGSSARARAEPAGRAQPADPGHPARGLAGHRGRTARLPLGPARAAHADTRAQEPLAMLLERAAEALTLNRLVERDQVSLVHQAHRALLADVLQGHADERELRARAGRSGCRPTAGCWSGSSSPAALPEELDPVSAEARDRSLAEAVTDALAGAGTAGLVSDDGPDRSSCCWPSRPRGRPRRCCSDLSRARQPVACAGLAARARRGRGPARRTRVAEGVGLDRGGRARGRRRPRPAGRPGPSPTTRSGTCGCTGCSRSCATTLGCSGSWSPSSAGCCTTTASTAPTWSQLLRAYVDAGGNKSVLARDRPPEPAGALCPAGRPSSGSSGCRWPTRSRWSPCTSLCSCATSSPQPRPDALAQVTRLRDLGPATHRGVGPSRSRASMPQDDRVLAPVDTSEPVDRGPWFQRWPRVTIVVAVLLFAGHLHPALDRRRCPGRHQHALCPADRLAGDRVRPARRGAGRARRDRAHA